MKGIFFAWLIVLILQASGNAADRIRVGIP